MPDTSNAVFIEAAGPQQASVIWLHGLGADGHDFEPIVPELQLPPQHGIRFVFPHAPSRAVTINGGMAMPAWYDVRNMDLRQDEDAAAIRDSSALIEAFIEAELDRGTAARQIVLAGFSQGGAIALHCGLRYRQQLAGILALSTYLPLPATLADEAATENRQTPIMMCHGLFDPVIPLVAGENSCRQLQAAGYPVSWHSYPMQHAVCMEEIVTIGRWLQQCLPVTRA